MSERNISVPALIN